MKTGIFATLCAVFLCFHAGADEHWTPLIEFVHYPASTTNPRAQQDFNEGLTEIFAFNHDLAFLKYQEAAKVDPNLAMAYWGMALALGQNINQDVTPENEKEAYNYSRKALSLLSHASPVERAYIQALAVRYSDDPKRDLVALRHNYCNAMEKAAKQFPEDLDAACLYVESILNLNPWKYWTWDGQPKARTMEAIELLRIKPRSLKSGRQPFLYSCLGRIADTRTRSPLCFPPNEYLSLRGASTSYTMPYFHSVRLL